MAKQATAFGLDNGDAWAFGPPSRALRPKAVRQQEPAPQPEPEPLFEPLVESIPTVDALAENGHQNGSGDYAQPAVLVADYQQPAVFSSNGHAAEILAEPSEPPASQRDVWDQLPAERARRRSRRYVGKHRA
jgi:hypothetical protein